MYILYLDDSGSVANPAEDYFVLGGVCVPETSIRWLSHQVECIAQEVSPADPGTVEFHASEIFGGREGVWKTIPSKVDRIAIIKRVLRVLDNAYADVVIFACAVHKRSFPTQDPVQLAFEDLSRAWQLKLQLPLPSRPTPTTIQSTQVDFARVGRSFNCRLAVAAAT